MNQFTKENLQEHDIIILRDKNIFMLYKFNNNLHLVSRINSFSTIADYNDDLKNQKCSYSDIIEIKRPSHPQQFVQCNWQNAPTIWKRQEKPILSNEEYIVLKNVNNIYSYIVRSADESLYLYDAKPKKSNNHWSSKNDWGAYFPMYVHLFKFIKWEGNEPYFIPKLLKEYEDYKKYKLKEEN